MDNEIATLKKENLCLREDLTNQRVNDVTRRVDVLESEVQYIKLDIKDIKETQKTIEKTQTKIYITMTTFIEKYKFVVFKWSLGVIIMLAIFFTGLYITQGQSISKAKDEIITTLIDERLKSDNKDKFK